jgi:hypothetical protein
MARYQWLTALGAAFAGMSFHAPLAHPGWMNRNMRRSGHAALQLVLGCRSAFTFSHEWETVPEGRMRAGARSATEQLVLVAVEG